MRGLLFMGALFAVMGCGSKADPCPIDVDFTGDELPCSCGSLTIEAMPGDGSFCSCNSDGTFNCVLPDTGTADDTGTDDTGT